MKRLLKNLFRYNKENQVSHSPKHFLMFQALMGAAFIFAFSINRAMRGEWSLAIFDVTLTLAFLCIYWLAKHDKLARLIIMLFVYFAILSSWVAAYLEGENSFLWSFPVILITFYLMRVKDAFIASIINLVVCTGIHMLQGNSPFVFIACYTLVSVYALQFSLIMRTENSQLTDKAYTDVLTGLGNRRAMENAILDIFNDKQRHNSPYSIIMFDIDYFKRINDDFGHDVGDRCLKNLGDLLRNIKIANAKLYRYGGEEFSVLVIGNIEAAANIAETIRKTIENSQIIRERMITISAGITEITDLNDIRQYVQKADQLLYQAKLNGRNTICVDSLAD